MAKKKEPKAELPSSTDGMKEYINERLNVRFTIPEKITIREQLAYRGRIAGTRQDDIFVRHWVGAVPLIQEWTSCETNGDGYKPCEVAAEPGAIDLDKETSPEAADVVFWASSAVAGHMMELGQVPKND